MICDRCGDTYEDYPGSLGWCGWCKAKWEDMESEIQHIQMTADAEQDGDYDYDDI